MSLVLRSIDFTLICTKVTKLRNLISSLETRYQLNENIMKRHFSSNALIQKSGHLLPS